MNNPYQHYQNNSVMTATGGELTLMLYNGAIKFCNKAIEAIESKNIQEAHTNIIKAQKIIDELIVTLDTKYPISIELEKMYTFIKDQLIEANLTKDVKYLEVSLMFIREFRDLWKEVMKNGKAG